MAYRALNLAAVLLLCALHLSTAVPKAQDQVQVIRGPDVVIEEKPVVVEQTHTVVENVQIVEGHRGCFRDYVDRDLPRLAHSGSNSVQLCRAACQKLGFKYAGVQNSNECWCGNFYGKYGRAYNCNMKCTADQGQTCGGAWANNVYRLESWVPPQPEGQYGHFGCFRDTGNRDLPRLAIQGSNSIELCITACKNLGFKYAGVQHTTECWCGNFFGKFGRADNCNMRCSANPGQICGGAWANNVFVANELEDPQPQGPLGYFGCFRDNAQRDLPHLAIKGLLSVELCKAACQKASFKYAGVQHTDECWCGNYIAKYGKADNCNMKCSANNDELCGGPWAYNAYSSSPVELPQPEGPLGHYGCYRDNAQRDLPVLAIQGSNSVYLCKEACGRLKYKFSAVQHTTECWCGNSFGKYGRASNCNMICNANHAQICGGAWANNVYRTAF